MWMGVFPPPTPPILALILLYAPLPSSGFPPLPLLIIIAQSLNPLKNEKKKTLMNWCRPRMPHYVTNYDFIGSMIPIMQCNSRTHPLLVPCRINVNFCLIRIAITHDARN